MGVATGVYRYLYPPPQISPSKLFMGEMTSERLFNSFISPKNFYTPKTNFWLRPCHVQYVRSENYTLLQVRHRRDTTDAYIVHGIL